MARLPKGLDDIRRNLNRELKRIGGGTDAGLVKFGLLVKKGAQINAPSRVGNLRASGYTVDKAGEHKGEGPQFQYREPGGEEVAALTRSEKQLARGLAFASDKRRKQAVVVGFGAPYAAEVHETRTAGAVGYDPEEDTQEKTAAQVHSKVGGPKFLERSLQDNAARGLAILAGETKI